MEWIIERFEGDIAVLGCGDLYFNVPIKALPKGAREGDVLDILINTEKTLLKTQDVKSRLKKLFGE